MKSVPRRVSLVAAGCLLLSALAGAAWAQPQNDIAAIRKDIEALKAGQAALEKQMQEIKNMLRPAQPDPVMDAPPNATVQISGAPTKGEAAAKLVMIEFSDYQCPFCGRYIRDSWPSIDRDYIQTGRLRYVFRSFPLESIHRQALKAHEAAACAGAQSKYWLMHAQLFAHQTALDLPDLKQYARAIGLDTAAFDKCLDSGQMTAAVRQDASLGAQIGVTGTPVFLIGTPRSDGTVAVAKVITGALPYAMIKQTLDAMLATK